MVSSISGGPEQLILPPGSSVCTSLPSQDYLLHLSLLLLGMRVLVINRRCSCVDIVGRGPLWALCVPHRAYQLSGQQSQPQRGPCPGVPMGNCTTCLGAHTGLFSDESRRLEVEPLEISRLCIRISPSLAQKG